MNNITRQFIESNNKFIYDNKINYTWHNGVYSIQRYSNDAEIHTGIPNTKLSQKKVKAADSLLYPNATVYECSYTFNEIGMRPIAPGENDSITIFFGDSQTFGQGVNDNETLPYIYSTIDKSYCYNFAMPNYTLDEILAWTEDEYFKSQFKNIVGKVFLIYRDEMAFSGEAIGADLFTEQDYITASNKIKQIKNNLKELSYHLDFYVVMIPLAFTSYILESNLEGVNCINLSLLDFEWYCEPGDSRFLDGVHTTNSNFLVAYFIQKYFKDKVTIQNPFGTIVTNESEFVEWIKFRSFFISWMADFPYDDFGIIASQKLKESNLQIDIDKVIDIAIESWKYKAVIIQDLRENNALPWIPYDFFQKDNVIMDIKAFDDNVLIRYLPENYIDLFYEVYIRPFLLNIL